MYAAPAPETQCGRMEEQATKAKEGAARERIRTLKDQHAQLVRTLPDASKLTQEPIRLVAERKQREADATELTRRWCRTCWWSATSLAHRGQARMSVQEAAIQTVMC